jgi:hypothetical protein
MVGAFANFAMDLANNGLAVIPLGGDDGKVPLIKYGTLTRPPGRGFISKLSRKFPDANVGVLCGLSGVTVVDIDDPAVFELMIDRCGDTPLKIATPSGGFHLWYKANGERSANLREQEGLDVDVKAIGGLVVVPPSIRLSGVHAGMSYTLLSGTWNDVDILPFAKLGSLPTHNETPVHSIQAVKKGHRNDFLHSQLLKQAQVCDDFDALLDVARTLNEGFSPPLTDTEVIKTAHSAWNLQVTGRNWSGTEPRIVLVATEWMFLAQYPYALALYGVLKALHMGRMEPFAICSEAMWKAKVILGWGEQRYTKARQWLVKNGFLRIVHQGGTGKGDASKYTFAQPTLTLIRKGSESDLNINKHPSPSLGDESERSLEILDEVPGGKTAVSGQK